MLQASKHPLYMGPHTEVRQLLTMTQVCKATKTNAFPQNFQWPKSASESLCGVFIKQYNKRQVTLPSGKAAQQQLEDSPFNLMH